MNLIISKNRSWRIELCDNIQFECDESEKHTYFIELNVNKTSTYNIFCFTLSI